jgi:predicted hotdog family 3-hydroxylacyl-ACP dehydratase
MEAELETEKGSNQVGPDSFVCSDSFVGRRMLAKDKAFDIQASLIKNSAMPVDFPVSELLSYLPHREPMVWINRVTAVGKDYKGLAGTCVVDLDPHALYMSEGHELRGSSAIEFTAQGFGYIKAAYQEIHDVNDPPSKTYLTGIRSCKADFSKLDLKTVKQLEIKISVVRELLPLTYVKGVITLPGDDVVIAETEIQVYVD